MAIAVVLATVAAAPFGDALASMRMRSATADVVSDLVLARSEALKRGETVSLRPKQSAWTNGWEVVVVSTGEVLGNRNPLGKGVSFASNPTEITFGASGRLDGVSSAARFSLVGGQGSARCVSVDPSGRPKSSKSACPLSS